MTTAASSKTAAKPAPVTEKSTSVEEKTETPVVEEKTVRIPSELNANPILINFCEQYLEAFDEISAYNKEVLAAKDSEWTPAKILEQARTLARPTDKNVKPNETIKKAVVAFEDAANALNLARRNALEVTAKEMGITLTATTERNSEAEAPLKEKRKLALVIGSQLMQIAEMTNDETAAQAVTKFFAEYKLPAIGRDQAHSFSGPAGGATPKYRVTVVVTDKDGNEKLREDGFTKAALGLTKMYPRGEAPKSDVLRKFWEDAGNTSDNTKVSPVEFEDTKAGLKFSIIKK